MADSNTAHRRPHLPSPDAGRIATEIADAAGRTTAARVVAVDAALARIRAGDAGSEPEPSGGILGECALGGDGW